MEPLETESSSFTYSLPRLKRGPQSLTGEIPSRENEWYVSREILELRNEFLSMEYLRHDGTWHRGMDIGYTIGGTYFKTLQEVIDVLCEFNIHVIGPDDEE